MRRALYPGTFDPIHNGHIDITTRASKLFDELVVAVYDKPLKSLLFDAKTRLALAQEALSHLKNVKVLPYSGLTVSFADEIGALAIVRGLRFSSDFEFELRNAMANRRMKPDIDTINLITSEENTFISSSLMKEIALSGGDVSSMVPGHVSRALIAQYEKLLAEN